MSEPVICQRAKYDCLNCGRACTEEYLSQFEPVTMAYDLAEAGLCFYCYGRDLETSGQGVMPDA